MIGFGALGWVWVSLGRGGEGRVSSRGRGKEGRAQIVELNFVRDWPFLLTEERAKVNADLAVILQLYIHISSSTPT